MPLAKLDAAEFGTPGRTEIVGSRHVRPSAKPLREYSLTISSPMALVASYVESGCVAQFAEAVDSLLRNVARSYGRSGGEHGAIDSRTSILLASRGGGACSCRSPEPAAWIVKVCWPVAIR